MAVMLTVKLAPRVVTSFNPSMAIDMEAPVTVDQQPMILPKEGRCPFDPPSALLHGDAVRRLRYADGHLGWLVTGHAAAKAVLMDPHFSVNPSLQHQPLQDRPRFDADAGIPPGLFAAMDGPEHIRFRKVLARYFNPRASRLLEPEIANIVERQLGLLATEHGPVDLISAFALPVHSRVICHLIGVPPELFEHFAEFSKAFTNRGMHVPGSSLSVAGLLSHTLDLVERRRRQLGTDFLSSLIHEAGLTDDEICGITLLLFSAGHETTVNTFALALLALFGDVRQFDAARFGETPMTQVVEELLRYVSIVDIRERTATEDIRVNGCRIGAGESVTISLAAANRDAAKYSEPLVLNLGRSAEGHLGFGHGVHHCLGQHVARAELRIGLEGLLRRFPDIRLAVDVKDLRFTPDLDHYGIYALPVAWGRDDTDDRCVAEPC
jgi:cytochrome P450